jgi:NADPH:quinone reductase-like Zn-dependent oxidoreductase
MQVLIEVKAASINPGEAKIREGVFHKVWPASFPSGEGSDYLAGIVTQVGVGVEGVTVGDEVIGFTSPRASHAEYVLVDAQNITRKPANVSWEVAGSLAIAGSTAYASVRAPTWLWGAVPVGGMIAGFSESLTKLAQSEVNQHAQEHNEDLGSIEVTPTAP